MKRHLIVLLSVMSACLFEGVRGRAGAAMTLTPAAVAQGFSLSTFATGFPNTESIGPLGMVFPNGGVLVTSWPGNTYFFTRDVDNQVVPAPTHAYGFRNADGLALGNGGVIYMTQAGNGSVVTVDAGGAILSTIIAGSFVEPRDVVINPTNGHLFVSQNSATLGIVDIDPVAKTFRTFEAINSDGLTLTPDGKTLYTAVETGPLAGHVVGFDTTTGAQVFDSGAIAGMPDGTALGFGTLAGNLFANTNGGTLVEVNLATGVQTLLATGGSRGDYVKVDPNNNTLLLTQTDSILRLTPPSGGGFGPLPEPSSLAMASLAALIGLGVYCRRGH
jgi:hypothetical protein